MMRENRLKSIYLYFFLIGIIFLSFYQFLTPISYLPLTIPFEDLLLRLGLLGLYLTTISLGLINLLDVDKLAKLMGLLVLSSLFLSLIPEYNISLWWEFFEVFSIGIGSALAIEGLMKSKRWLLLPILFVVEFGEVEGVMEDFFHTYINTSFFTLLVLLVITGFVLLVYKWKPKRLLISLLVGIPGLLVFLPLYFIVLRNRFMEIIFAMVFPAVYGITLNNPYNVPLMILFYALAFFLSFALGYHIDLYTGLGYYMIVTTAFLGITGFHFYIFMIFPLVGFYFMNVKGEISPTLKDYIKSMRKK